MKIFSGYTFRTKDTIESTPPNPDLDYKKVTNLYKKVSTGRLVVVTKA